MLPAGPDGQATEPNHQAEGSVSQLLYSGACQVEVLSSMVHNEGGKNPRTTLSQVATKMNFPGFYFARLPLQL